MAKDDYFVIVYKVLLYYYGCLKRKYVFDEDVFWKTIGVPSGAKAVGLAAESHSIVHINLKKGGASQ